ncbi:hypothetical protein ABH955_004127 [Bacillus sp. RC240]|uniref:hypothetical protein n=1 Tax=Bacillus sp. RC240 TaxID=3156285 RepID=UPI003834BC67
MVIRTKRENLARKGVDENKGSGAKTMLLAIVFAPEPPIFYIIGVNFIHPKCKKGCNIVHFEKQLQIIRTGKPTTVR